MTLACSSEPISFLRFERYLQGDLDAVEHHRIDAHLGECSVCRECFESLRADPIELPPLPVPTRPRRRRYWVPLTAAASAAALLLFLRVGQTTFPSARVRVKGGELALELVREHAGSTGLDPGQFASGDRFQVRVSCPPGAPMYWDVIVYQRGERYFPLDASAPLTCANAVTLPGAFSLDGTDDARVCVVIQHAQPFDRERLTAADDAALPGACAVIKPTP